MSQRIAIKSIKIGERRRDEENLGDIDGLAKSIAERGLIHPIVVDTNRRLIAGRRRLEACKRLGHKMIECTLYNELDEEELRAIELDENVERKDLTAAERSRKFIAEKEREAEGKPYRSSGRVNESQNSDAKKPGPKPSQNSQKSIARATGTPQQTLNDAKRHVAACERYPFLAGSHWSQAAALRVAGLLDELPAGQRRAILDLVKTLGAPPSFALTMITTFAQISEEARDRLLEASRSKDSRVRDAAGTFLAGTAAIPDPRSVHLSTIAADLRGYVRRFPEDDLNPKLEALIAEVEGIRDMIRRQHKARIEEFACQLK